MRSRKLYNILAKAIVDKSLRDSIFHHGGDENVDWQLNQEESAYLKNLQYASFERMVGGMVSHWLIPRVVNDSYLIIPENVEDTSSNGYTQIRLAGSLAFGNGAHPTTSLCLAAVDTYLQPGYSVLDLGTGSGILAIAAALKGAQNVLALDDDPGAVDTTKKNAKLNRVESVVYIGQGSLAEAQQAAKESGGFDLVLANIFTPVILSFLEGGLADVLMPGGILVMSGIEKHEIPTINNAGHNADLTSIEIEELEGWIAYTTQKQIN